MVQESHQAVDSVLNLEKEESRRRRGHITSYDMRNKAIARQYSREFANAYHRKLNHMVERRMKGAIQLTADVWYTCWVNAGQPDLALLNGRITEDTVSDTYIQQHSRNAVHK